MRSAGLIEAPHEIVTFVTDYLTAKGLDVFRHQPTNLTRTTLDEANLAITMGTGEPLLDVFEVVPDWRTNEAAAIDYGRWVIDYIIDGNGRHSRLMADILAMRMGYTSFSWGRTKLINAGEARKRYISALRAADQYDIEPLIDFAQSYAFQSDLTTFASGAAPLSGAPSASMKVASDEA